MPAITELTTNGKIELDSVGPNSTSIGATLPGWITTNTFEVLGDGYLGVRTRDGGDMMEIDAVNGTVSQTMKTIAGTSYDISFDLAGKPGGVASSKIAVLWNGVVIATIAPTNSVMTTFVTKAIGTGGNDVMSFRAVTGDTDNVGGLLDNVSVTPTAPTSGSWDPLSPWPLVAIHSVVTQDGKVLTFGTNLNGAQGATMYHDLYDPVTKTHTTIDHQTHTPTDIFCSAAIIIPGTDKILISGGDARPLGQTNQPVNDSNTFSTTTHQVSTSPEGEMAVPRWYNTMVSLASGQIINMGGLGAGGVVEIYTEGEGWRTLTGATDAEISETWYYPRAWVGSSGEVIYFATGSGANGVTEVMALDPSGQGSIRQVGALPFATANDAPAIMYDVGKVLIMADNGELWTMNISGVTPVFAKVGFADQDRNNSNMTVLADGKVLINGGTSTANLEIGAILTSLIWDPDTGTLTKTLPEAHPRMYHSTAVLLTDGTVLSAGGGSLGSPDPTVVNYLDSQIYKPPYLFDANGNEAPRPVISGAPTSVKPGETFSITVDNAATITKLTFIKTGASTHTFNMDARAVDLTFEAHGNELHVTVPENASDVTAGSWMLFAWNDQGVPSIAPIIAVQPSIPTYDGIGDVTAEYFTISAAATSLDQIDFNTAAAFTQHLVSIDKTGTGAIYTGGPADDFAVRMKADFTIDKAGSYTFYLTHDDGARLKIDGVLVTEFKGTGANRTDTGTVTLTAGEHKAELVYFDASGASRLDLDWAGPGFARTQMTFDGADDNLIANGGFEHADGTLVNAAPFNWTMSGPGGPSRGAGMSATGDGWYNFSPSTTAHGGTIQQTIDTVAGHTYTLTFSSGVAWQAATGTFNAQLKADVSTGATAITSQNIQLGQNTTKGYNDYTVTFTATGPQTTIKFTDTSPTGQADFDVGLDNVVVKPADGSNEGPATPPVIPVDPNNLAINGSFETVSDPGMTMPMAHVLANGGVPGWTSSANRIEMWMNGYNGVIGTDGNNVVEIDAQNGVLSQAIKTDAGKAYGITFDYAGQAGAIASSAMEVLWNGVVVSTINPADAAFKNYHVHAFGTGGDDVLAFRAVAGDTDALGGLLDKVVVAVSGHAVANTITGTAGDDYIIDTNADDIIKAGAGDDTIVLRNAGNDTVDGEAGNNHVDLEGAAANYTFNRDASGNATVTSAATGTDTLQNIKGFYFYGEEKWYDLAALVPATSNPGTGTGTGTNTITGTAGDDYIIDTNANDVIKAGAGDDTIVLRNAGNDTVDGEAGNNHVDLEGAAANYTFNRDANGNATVTSAATGTDTLQNIKGFYFYGEEKWYDLAALVPATSNPGTGANTITGTAGDDYIIDTNANDVIKAGTGDDTIVLRNAGNDTVDGEAGNNHVDLEGAAANYTFGRDASGNATVTSAATGTDTLQNIKGFYFYGEAKWYDLAALVPATGNPGTGTNTITGTTGNDYIVDTNANDVIKAGTGDDTIVLRNAGNDTVDGEAGNNHVDLEGAAANYTFGRDASGNATVTSAATGTDTLQNIKGFYFYGEEKWYDLDALVPPATANQAIAAEPEAIVVVPADVHAHA